MKPKIQEQIEDLLLWRDPDSRILLRQLAEEHCVPVDALMELLAFMRESQTKLRTRGITETCDDVFDNQNYWGT
ncbi:hypothetical protein [Stenoxybacter acetivorans]|uniref:hypothetical protein n=1 Tax=Stenoxybacter acetivorans TaxID=422441 RepID=UPI00055D58EE|nr:hypothetical protein [Stenoxybacter acetivorans]